MGERLREKGPKRGVGSVEQLVDPAAASAALLAEREDPGGRGHPPWGHIGHWVNREGSVEERLPAKQKAG